MFPFYFQKSTEIDINIGRQQKQVIDVYIHPLKAPPRIEAHQKGSLNDFIAWTSFWSFMVYPKI